MSTLTVVSKLTQACNIDSADVKEPFDDPDHLRAIVPPRSRTPELVLVYADVEAGHRQCGEVVLFVAHWEVVFRGLSSAGGGSRLRRAYGKRVSD